MDIKKKLYDNYKSLAEKVLPDLKTSNFVQTGMLTKKEFQITGNYLIQNDPLWEWQKEGVCLIKRRIRCTREEIKEDTTDNGDSNSFNVYSYKSSSLNAPQNITNANTNTNTNTENMTNNTHITQDNRVEDGFESDDSMGMSYLEDDSLIYADEASLSALPKTIDTAHYYDITITYDDYYRTPRIWFQGTNTSGKFLEDHEIYNDFDVEKTKVSLTMEEHPIIAMNVVSVHPCKHAHAMKRMFVFEQERQKDQDEEITIEKYLVHFLKFVSCVIPQLSFDLTSIE